MNTSQKARPFLVVAVVLLISSCSGGPNNTALPVTPNNAAFPVTRSDSGSRRTTTSFVSGTPGSYTDDPNTYNIVSSPSNADMGAAIINHGSSIGGGGGCGGHVCPRAPVGRGTSSTTRRPMSFQSFNCQDWYQAAVPGVHNQVTDTYLGTTCDTIWIPDNFGSTGGYRGGGGDGLGCEADNMDDGSCVATLPKSQQCANARPLNTPANGESGHNNQISNVLEVYAHVGNTTQLLGWNYQTYGGQEYFQFAFTLSVGAGVVSMSTATGPTIPNSGNFYQMLLGYAKDLNIAQSQLPYPLDVMNKLTRVNEVDCYAS